MSWSSPPTFIAGTVFTAANANVLSNDLTALSSSVGLYAKGTAEYGSPSSTLSPGNYYIQAGQASLTFASGFVAFAFPSAFPTGLLSFVGHPQNNNPSNPAVLSHYSAANSSVELTLTVSGSAYTGSYTISYIAIGF